MGIYILLSKNWLMVKILPPFLFCNGNIQVSIPPVLGLVSEIKMS